MSRTRILVIVLKVIGVFSLFAWLILYSLSLYSISGIGSYIHLLLAIGLPATAYALFRSSRYWRRHRRHILMRRKLRYYKVLETAS